MLRSAVAAGALASEAAKPQLRPVSHLLLRASASHGRLDAVSRSPLAGAASAPTPSRSLFRGNLASAGHGGHHPAGSEMGEVCARGAAQALSSLSFLRLLPSSPVSGGGGRAQASDAPQAASEGAHSTGGDAASAQELLRGSIRVLVLGGAVLGGAVMLIRPRKKGMRLDRAKSKKQYRHGRHVGGWNYRWLGS
ncbi:hypothetical protein BESB_066710 [Besnoitia besnoiti]|uniref:Transmembrane protein n=1 Tax=Besnoitia besnoiti TaxID=94643 RepID=A0A2A9M835_BESBE|nr:hypothetical protein BESB_066710 [Besnoitia besnoiti]PFH34638.1 hypothetical protein BESB_066710 [Besnoitia besnoiti]